MRDALGINDTNSAATSHTKRTSTSAKKSTGSGIVACGIIIVS